MKQCYKPEFQEELNTYLYKDKQNKEQKKQFLMRVFGTVKQKGGDWVKETERPVAERLIQCMALIMQSKVAQNFEAFEF